MTVAAEEVVVNGSGVAGLLQEEFGVPALDVGAFGDAGLRGGRKTDRRNAAGV